MTATTLRFNPFSPEFHDNPYPTYDRLRREDPIHRGFLNAWVITRYDDTETILKDSRFQVDDLPERLRAKSAYLNSGDFQALAATIQSWLFFLEPPHHTRLRGLVSKAFAAHSVEALRPHIEKAVASLLDRVIPQGRMDVIQDLAGPLPAMTVTHILGLPPEDYPKLVRWSYELFFVFDQPMSIEGYTRQNEMALEARAYLEEAIARFEVEPNDGLISRLIAARDEGNKLSQEEILGFCIMLLIVGQETTKSLIGNSIVALTEHPEQMQQLKARPEIVKSAIEELLRYDSPVQVLARLASEDVEMRGKTIQAGDKVIVCLGAASRDPDRFPQPDRLDFNRQNRNLPFGGGIHFCLGAFLARVQGQVAIAAIAQRLSNIRLDSDRLDWRESITLRGLLSLPITFDRDESVPPAS
ncbi:MAG: cytochrome P450 [Cyanobacteria bacterium J06639_1]